MAEAAKQRVPTRGEPRRRHGLRLLEDIGALIAHSSDPREPCGVLIVQTSRRRRFTRDEVRLLKAIAVPIAGILAQARLRASLESKEEERRTYQQRMDDAIGRLGDYETDLGGRADLRV